MTVSEQTWFITGASSGIGRALAAEIVSRGSNVVAAARDKATLSDLVSLAPDRVLAIQLDVTKLDQIRDAVTAAVERFGAIEVLVNNAGYGFLSTLEEAAEPEIRQQFDTNLFGPIALMQAVLPGMRERRSGLIINVSSTAGSRGIPGSGYYCASKSALEAVTEALAGEGEALGIRAMIVSPGPFRTDFFGRSHRLPANQIEDYGVILEQRKEYVAWEGRQRGDPARAARIIADVAGSANLPMRLALGGTACETLEAVIAAKGEDLAFSRPICAMADFPEVN